MNNEASTQNVGDSVSPFSFRGKSRRLVNRLIIPAVLLTACCASWMNMPSQAADTEATVIQLKALRFKYDKPRFKVEPGVKVKLIVTNEDEMMHNLAILLPGARIDIVKAATNLGSEGPKLNYVPRSPKVLHATPVLSPGATQTITFTAPKKEGVYPYVCTYPGHGFIMYGAMYVTRNELPPIADDPHVPPPLPEMDMNKKMFMQPHHGAVVVREFMPDCGPAAIAVGMPGGQSFCWDAGQCRLRYAWSGGFINVPYRKNDRGKIEGEVYFRASTDAFPLRIGSTGTVANAIKKAAPSSPKVEFLGYRLIDSFPQFHYRVDGFDVREIVHMRPDGPGIMRTFEVADNNKPVTFTTNRDKSTAEGVKFSATAGQWKGNTLHLSAEEAKRFTVTIAAPKSFAPSTKKSAEKEAK